MRVTGKEPSLCFTPASFTRSKLRAYCVDPRRGPGTQSSGLGRENFSCGGVMVPRSAWRSSCARVPHVVGAASGSQPDKEMISAATQVDEMVREIFNELFVSSSARYLLEGSQADGNDESNELGEILSKVVSPRLDTMPAAVPAMIDQYLLALQSNYGSTSNDDIVKVLILLKEHILDRIEASMPAEVRDLQRLVDAQDARARADIYSITASSAELLESCFRLLRQLEEDTPMLDARHARSPPSSALCSSWLVAQQQAPALCDSEL